MFSRLHHSALGKLGDAQSGPSLCPTQARLSTSALASALLPDRQRKKRATLREHTLLTKQLSTATRAMRQRTKPTFLQASKLAPQVQTAGQHSQLLSLTPVKSTSALLWGSNIVRYCPLTMAKRVSAASQDMTFTFISSRLAGRGPGLPTAALLFCLISPLEPEDTEDVLLTVAE